MKCWTHDFVTEMQTGEGNFGPEFYNDLAEEQRFETFDPITKQEGQVSEAIVY